MIEIRDGLLAMRPHMNAEAAASATGKVREAGLTGEARHAAVEAARLKSALRAKADGQSVLSHPVGGDAPSRTGEDFAGELDWLLQVAKAFAAVQREQGEVRDEVPFAR